MTPKLDLEEAERLLQGLRANKPFFEPDFFRFCMTFVPRAVERVRKLEESTHNLDSWINDELLPEIDSLRTQLAELEAQTKETNG